MLLLDFLFRKVRGEFPLLKTGKQLLTYFIEIVDLYTE